MSSVPSVPSHSWKTAGAVVPNRWTRHSTTIHVSTPSVSTFISTPGVPVPSRSVQYGARTLLGRAGSPMAAGGQHRLSAPSPPPTTT